MDKGKGTSKDMDKGKGKGMRRCLFIPLLLYFYFLVIAFPLHLFAEPHLFSINSSSMHSEESLASLEEQVLKELQMITLKSQPWILPQSNNEILDVAIVGGGMAGMAAALALIREGITNICIFDENPQNQEGPWLSYARMIVLRSSKTCIGPSLGIPSLTFCNWYERLYGQESWKRMKAVPTKLWNDYLNWFRRVLKLPTENNVRLFKIIPSGENLELYFNIETELARFKKGQQNAVIARKVILATGRNGSGDVEIPHFIKGLPKKYYAHTGEIIDPQLFHDKRIVIIGAGASAFDAAAVALENGAAHVQILIRRPQIPAINKFSQFDYPGFVHGFYYLPDQLRCQYFAEAFEYGIPPPKDALERIKGYENLNIRYNIEIQDTVENGTLVKLETNKGTIETDYIVLGTGYSIDLSQRHELEVIKETILLWEHRLPSDLLQKMPKLGRFPYLGPHFEFLEAIPGSASFLKNIYCFNYGAFLSHGLISGDIGLISVGATRLAQGIAIDFFIQGSSTYFQKFKDYQSPAYSLDDYDSIIKKQ